MVVIDMVFNVTFNNISIIPSRSVLLVEETEVPGENHRSVASHWLQLPVQSVPITTNVVGSNPVHGDTTLCDIVCQWLATDRWFSPGTSVSSTNKKKDKQRFTEHNIKHAYTSLVLRDVVIFEKNKKQTNITTSEQFQNLTDKWWKQEKSHIYDCSVSSYICDFSCFHHLSVRFWNCSDVVIFVCFLFFSNITTPRSTKL
jgi:hypothetical protein